MHLDDGDLGAVCVVNVGKLNANCSSANDDHALWLFFENHGFLGADAGSAIEW